MKEQFSIKAEREVKHYEHEPAFTEAYTATNEALISELYARHAKKLFHDPGHTLGTSEQSDLTSVRGGIKSLSSALRASFTDSLSGKEAVATLVEQGMETGAVGHDAIIELDGIADNGMIKRRRGWNEGGNERESFRLTRRTFLKHYLGSADELSPEEEALIHSLLIDKHGPEYDESYATFMTATERVVAGTEPDAMNFAYQIDAEQYLKDYPPAVLERLLAPGWSEENPQYQCMMIDSTKADTSLEGLLGSTADLGAVSHPEVFKKTGNAEFWELQYGMAKTCAEFFENPGVIDGDAVQKIVRAMDGWRRTQVGVAVGQRIRLEQKYTPDNITRLFAETFGVVPDEAEVEKFIGSVKVQFAEAEQSVLLAAEIHQAFTERYAPLLTCPPGPLDEQNSALFKEAIAFMDADQAALSGYVNHVDESLAKSGL